ncbi:abc transporter integral membrane protein [Treponema primitia ZAS-2]|uniref:Abc transporter integral membrane protein n=1 Tax=Treponema primitia (strain ATCC BAA-887 / DSM 12427 / ZAS-2) TaxID=545694 RepID=F5YKZ3_TREPZ|nr:iron ABC transporter permease [Treponema primitia]AEF84824.1 abc transporter integral membrane protein [Treponema primitia ZAS-2]
MGGDSLQRTVIVRNIFPIGTGRRNSIKTNTGLQAALLFALLPLAAVLLAFILPYGAALSAGFRSSGSAGTGVTGGAAFSALANPALLRITLFTLGQAGLSALLALGLGLPGAWLLGSGLLRENSPGTRFIRALTSVPFAMPPILVVLGFVLFFGNSGWANRFLAALGGAEDGPLRILYRPGAIVLAHGFYNFPLVIRLVGDGMARARKAYAPAAETMGATPFLTGLTILFPLVLPSILSAALLVFLYSFTSFAVVLVLGGGPGATTLAVEIYRYARLSLDYSNAGALALIETLIASAVFMLYLRIERRTGNTLEIRDRFPDERRSAGGHIALIVYGVLLFLFVLGPLLSVPLESFLYKPSRAALPQVSARWWLSLGERILPALLRSLLLAGLSATLASVLAILAAGAASNLRFVSQSPGKAHGKSPLAALIRIFATAPLASSGIVLGFGWLSLYGRDHSRSLWAAVVLHAVTALPFAFNSISRGLESIPPNTSNAASVFGANPLKRIITVEIPLSMGRLRSAWGFSAAISLGELNAVMMLGLEDWETLPLLIYRAANSYRYGTACAAGTMLILACAGAFLLSEFGVKQKGGSHGY